MDTFKILIIVLFIFFSSCDKNSNDGNDPGIVTTSGTWDSLPPPGKSNVNIADVVGWRDGTKPKAPKGFKVNLYANNLEKPRTMSVLPNGDVLVAESVANRITLLRDSDKDGTVDKRFTFLKDLNKPFGILLCHHYIYVANQDVVIKYPYLVGTSSMFSRGDTLVKLPTGEYNQNWTRNLVVNPDSTKVYIAIGSASNVGEHGMKEERERARVLEMNTDGTGKIVYSWGLRNPVGMDFNPITGVLWVVVSERDGLGDELVPDFMTSLNEGDFFGWPWYYLGDYIDPRRKDDIPDTLPPVKVPEVLLTSHSTPLGLTFYTGNSFPEKYHNGAFVSLHGSWNRSELVGYQVAFIPFKDGKPSGKPEPFLEGFIGDKDKSIVYGKPVGLTIMKDGSLLVSDDGGNVIWRVSYSRNLITTVVP